MMLGHFALGFAAKPIARKVSLGFLLVATQASDIVYGVFAFAGATPAGGAGVWDHGLVMSAAWSGAAFFIALFIARDLVSGLAVGLLVLSHWVLDFIAWDKALPLAFGDAPRVGLGLYDSVVLMFVIDFGLYAAGIALYMLGTRAKDRLGAWAPWLLVAYILALIAPIALFSSGKWIVIVSLLMALTAPFGIWVDRHREAKA